MTGDDILTYEKLMNSEELRIVKQLAKAKAIIKDLERKIASQRGTIRVYNNKLKSRLEQVERLKQENIGLRKEIVGLKGEANSVLDNWCRGDDTCSHLKKRDEQLNRAKELLTRYVMASVYFNGKEADLIEEAEQFLREEN